jgi:hypothetical protein
MFIDHGRAERHQIWRAGRRADPCIRARSLRPDRLAVWRHVLCRSEGGFRQSVASGAAPRSAVQQFIAGGNRARLLSRSILSRGSRQLARGRQRDEPDETHAPHHPPCCSSSPLSPLFSLALPFASATRGARATRHGQATHSFPSLPGIMRYDPGNTMAGWRAGPSAPPVLRNPESATNSGAKIDGTDTKC